MEIDKIISELNLPKQVFDKSVALLEKLFGKGVDEYSGIIQDKIRFRRFKNQLRILAKANELLESSPYKPKEISLKVLVPLIEYSSLEEEPELQTKWANLIASISIQEDKGLVTKNYIDILNKLTSVDVKILDYLFNQMIDSDPEIKSILSNYFEIGDKTDLHVSTLKFYVHDVSSALHLNENLFLLHLENLMITGLLKWDVPYVRKNDWRNSVGLRTMDVYGSFLNKSEYFIKPSTKFMFTNLGLNFVKCCRFND